MLFNVAGNIKETPLKGEPVCYEHSMEIECPSESTAKLKFIKMFEEKSDPFGIKYHTWDVVATPVF